MTHTHEHKIEIHNEQKTLIVIVVTVATMILEISFGYLSKSMALLSDGFHMGTHAFALGIAYCTYIFIRKIKNNPNAAEISEKLSALAGYTSSLLLLASGLLIIVESTKRLIFPLQISFNEAILVAVIGLIVNLICIGVMGNHNHKHKHNNEDKHEDYNFKSAYLHIIADALTSIFAIFALVCGKFFGLFFLDPIMGFVGASLILKWSFGLIKDTSKILTGLDFGSERKNI